MKKELTNYGKKSLDVSATRCVSPVRLFRFCCPSTMLWVLIVAAANWLTLIFSFQTRYYVITNNKDQLGWVWKQKPCCGASYSLIPAWYVCCCSCCYSLTVSEPIQRNANLLDAQMLPPHYRAPTTGYPSLLLRGQWCHWMTYDYHYLCTQYQNPTCVRKTATTRMWL